MSTASRAWEIGCAREIKRVWEIKPGIPIDRDERETSGTFGFLPDTACRVEFDASHSKQGTDIRSTRHWTRGYHVAFVCTIWHSTRVIPFRVQFRPGIPLYEQVVYSAKKAMISGRLRPGDPFPSVRILSKELKINPNTAHKVVTQLAASGLLEIRPGIGTVVVAHPEASAAERAQLLSHEIEELVVEAKRLSINLQDMVASVSEHWKRLSAKDGLGGQPDREGSRKR